MKAKKIFLRLLKGIMLLLIILSVVACQENTNNNKVPPAPNTEILPPTLSSLGTYLNWDNVGDGITYQIYDEEKLVATTAKTTYKLEEQKVDSDYYIVACNTTGKTIKSNTVTVSKNTNFSSSEILDLSNETNYVEVISNQIRQIIIDKANLAEFYLDAMIAKRTTDLYLKLNNVSIYGTLAAEDYNYSKKENNYSVIIESEGNCTFKGRDGRNGSDFSGEEYNNKSYDAEPGGDGDDCIVVPCLIIKSQNSFKIQAGNGGNGGKGSGTTAYDATNTPGKGSDGGDGGTALKTSYLILDLANNSNTLTITDGKPGIKGEPGVNGSIITGALVTAMWKDMYDIGKNGKSGRSIINKTLIIKGELIFYES